MRNVRLFQKAKNLFQTAFKSQFMKNAIAAGLITDLGAEKNLGDTEMHQAFVVNANSLGYTFGDDDRPERVTMGFFATVSAFLSSVKVKKVDEAVALILQDVSGNFKFAGIVEYHDNEENPEEPGNWSYVMTFDSKTIDNLEKNKIVKKYLCSSTEFASMLDKVSYDIAGISYVHGSYMLDACLVTIDTLLQILDREATPDQIVDIELPGYFVASVSIENDVKIFAITPDGHMKQIIKDDSALDDLPRPAKK